MKAKHVFALYGRPNVGKSATLKNVFALLTDAYPTAPVRNIRPPGIDITVDITVVIEINGIFVGIESGGDPGGGLAESIELFKGNKCSIIICATRTHGGTVTAVKNLQPEFTLVWYHKTSEPQANLQARHDNADAQAIFDQVQNALKA
jgi:hypothetical protein